MTPDQIAAALTLAERIVTDPAAVWDGKWGMAIEREQQLADAVLALSDDVAALTVERDMLRQLKISGPLPADIGAEIARRIKAEARVASLEAALRTIADNTHDRRTMGEADAALTAGGTDAD